jgi:putative nucleotidyltransferase with HDIG domain
VQNEKVQNEKVLLTCEENTMSDVLPRPTNNTPTANTPTANTPTANTPTERDNSALLVRLTNLALQAENVPAAVTPILNMLIDETHAVGSAYFQADGKFFKARAASGVMPEGPAMDTILTHGLPAETPLMVTLREGTPALFFNDTHAHYETLGFPDLAVTSLAAAPVYDRKGVLLGAFLMHTFEPHAWTSVEQGLFQAVAKTLATLAARLVAEEQAKQAYEDAIHALGLALEHRDDETKGHTDRVTNLALRVADEMALDDDTRDAMRRGAYLHDIGKIAIPDAVLRKPGKLNDEEWQQMRAHTTIGSNFVAQLSFLPQATRDVVLHHHEKYNGQGYPEQLAGDDIPLLARIFAVVDVYDALTSERPYKPAWTHEDALAEIQNCAGSHFDPDVVAAFVRIF